MSEIDRYVSTRMLPSANGWNSSGVAHTYVRASDYDALQGDRGQQYDMKVKAREQRDKASADNKLLREALEKISAIEDEQFGGDWDEIEEARVIARAALGKRP